MARRVKRTRSGAYAVRLSPPERALLSGIPDLLRGILMEDDRQDPVMKRLFPVAFLDDTERAAEFDGLVRDDLVRQRLEALETMERTLASERISQDELSAWVAVINDARLVLGVRLGVTEESEPSDFASDEGQSGTFALYGYLSILEEDLVAALSEAV